MKPQHIIAAVLTLLLFVGIFTGSAAAATELITNGDFSNGLNGWNVDEPYGTMSGIIDVSHAGKTAALFSIYNASTDPEPTVSISQTIDVTGADTVTFKTKQFDFDAAGTFIGGSVSLTIYQNDVVVGYYTWNNIGTTWTDQSFSVASLTGNVTLKWEGRCPTTARFIKFCVTDISCLDLSQRPVITSAYFTGHYGNTGIGTQINTDVSVTYTVTDGIPPGARVVIDWGDNRQNQYTELSATKTHQYTSPGDYTVILTALGSAGSGGAAQVRVGYVHAMEVSFSAEPVSADPGSYIRFTANVSSTVGIASYAWMFEHGSTGYGSVVEHQYNSAGTYSPILTVTDTSGYTVEYQRVDYILIAGQSVSFNSTSVASGETVRVNWSLRSPDYSTPYILRIYPSSNTGEPISSTAVATHNITSSSQTYYNWTTGTGGYYTAIIEHNGQEIARSSTPVNVIVYVNLTVNVYDDQVPFTAEQTTVKLYQEGGTLYGTKYTGTNQYSVVWQNIPSGNYYVKISSATKTEKTSPTLALTDSYVLNMDFTRGSSEGGGGGGVGGQYATTFVTFRCQDSGTGKYVPGVHIVAQAVQPTNPWEYFVNIFGAAIGNVIQAMTLSGDSDSNGVITFVMYQNVRYRLTITYDQGGIHYSEERSFQQSALSGEYLIAIPITDNSKESVAENIVTAVETSGTDQIIAKFTDNSGTVSAVFVYIYQIVDGEEELVAVDPWNLSNPPQGQEQSHTFTLQNASGKSYYVAYEITSSKFGTVTKQYGVTFSGPRIKIGELPDEWYIWICFGILVMLGAVATFINSRMFAFVIPLVACFFMAAGWLFALGPAGPIAIVICFVLAIVYYIANGGGPV